LSYQIIWEQHGVVEQFSGSITSAQILSCNESVCADSRFDAIRYQIHDLLDVSMAEITDIAETLQLVERIAATDKAAAKSNPKVRIAIVTRHETLGTLASFYSSELSNSSWTCEIFESVAAARKWLGAPPPIKANN